MLTLLPKMVGQGEDKDTEIVCMFVWMQRAETEIEMQTYSLAVVITFLLRWGSES